MKIDSLNILNNINKKWKSEWIIKCGIVKYVEYIHNLNYLIKGSVINFDTKYEQLSLFNLDDIIMK